MTAVTLVPVPRCCGGGGKSGGYNMFLPVKAVVVLLFSCVFVPQATFGLLFGNHIVDASSLVFFLPSPGCERLLNAVHGRGCVV